ncbi:MAG TPA: helix-turn-helix transcriptional regulator [Caulobacteraceae bacterium]|nr:helix-turn-helix transcriptional regulator [Caulobacteraceae bacterium]
MNLAAARVYRCAMSLALANPVGDHLRAWRLRRRMSQLDLAGEAEISSRHLSFVETGRANPSRDMVLRLAERLEVPMRERNVLLVAAGYAPVFPDSELASPELTAVREAIEIILDGHRPYPAFALDRHWNVVASNGELPQLYDGVDPALLTPPVNVIRLSLSPSGLAPKIANLGEWRGHVLARLRRQVELTADPVLIALMDEAKSFSVRLPAAPPSRHLSQTEMLVPLRIRFGERLLSFLTTTLVFGTPLEVTLSELAVETFFPADRETAEAVKSLAG